MVDFRSELSAVAHPDDFPIIVLNQSVRDGGFSSNFRRSRLEGSALATTIH
jgi:hypothetical protein